MISALFAPAIRAGIAISCFPLIFAVGVVNAAEIKVLSANVFTGVLDVLAGDFERTTGHKVTIVYGTAGVIRNRVQAGESGDVTILPRPMMDEALRQGRITPGSIVDLAHSAVAVAVRTGAPKPDIRSVEPSSARYRPRSRLAILIRRGAVQPEFLLRACLIALE